MSLPPPKIPPLPQSGIAKTSGDENLLPNNPSAPPTSSAPSLPTVSNRPGNSDREPNSIFRPTAIPEHTQAIDDSFGYGFNHQQTPINPPRHQSSPRLVEQLPKGPQRFYFPPFILAAIAIAFVGMLAWWVVDEPELAALDRAPAPMLPRPAAILEPPALPIPAPRRLASSPPQAEPIPKRPKRPRKPGLRAKPKPKPQPKTSPLPPAYERKLDGKDIRDSLRPTRARVKSRCPAPPSRVSIKVQITVLPDGTVSAASIAPPFNRTTVGECIQGLVRATTFPAKERRRPSQVRAAFHVGPGR